MQRLRFLLLIQLVIFIGASPSIVLGAEHSQVTINPEQSNVEWTGKKVTGSHHGTVQIHEGHAYLSDGALTGGEFSLDMQSIAVKDIDNPKDNAKLTGHLQSDDFFSAEDHRYATFDITNVRPLEPKDRDGANCEIFGDLSIKGITRTIHFPARVIVKDTEAKATATVAVDRTKFNVRYGSGKFFENLGDKLIYDQFEVTLSLVGKIEAAGSS